MKCNTCNEIDDENHRLNYCTQWKDTNLLNSDITVDFKNVYSNDIKTLRVVIPYIQQVWNIKNANGTMHTNWIPVIAFPAFLSHFLSVCLSVSLSFSLSLSPSLSVWTFRLVPFSNLISRNRTSPLCSTPMAVDKTSQRWVQPGMIRPEDRAAHRVVIHHLISSLLQL